MDKKVYLRGKAGTCWYNFTEGIAYTVIHRKTPKGLLYEGKIPYGAEKKQYYNVCRRTADSPQPVFIYIHGGGWVSGITEMRDTYASAWAKKGFSTFCVGYTYAPERIFPAALQQILDAIDSIYDNAEKYNADMSKIVLAGESAGGWYITYLAAIATDKTLADKLNLSFRHNDVFSVNAVVNICGCYNIRSLSDRRKMQSKFPDMKMMVCSLTGKSYNELLKWLDTPQGKLATPPVEKGFPPTFTVWATMDFLRYEAFDLMQQLESVGTEYTEYKADGIIGMHAWALALVVKKGRACFDSAYEFVCKYI